MDIWWIIVTKCRLNSFTGQSTMKNWLSFAFLTLTAFCHAQQLRAPAVPLITHDPYFSIWSATDNLYDSPTTHWTGANHPLEGMIEVDGKVYRFLGKPVPGQQTVLANAVQQPYTAFYSVQKPADDWYKPTFEADTKAGTWKTGQAPFGTKNSNPTEKTVWDTDEIWLRRTFDLKDVDFNDLKLNIQHDDDVEVYLNGVPAYSCAPCYVGEYMMRDIFPEARKALKKGGNLLAIHCKNPRGGGFIDAGLVNFLPEKKPVPTAVQKSVRVRATQTHCEFKAGGVDLTVVFTSPLLMDDLETLGRPASYVTFRVKSNDGKTHSTRIHFSASGLIAANSPEQELQKDNGADFQKAGTKSQNVLGRKGDNVRIDWGYLYLTTDNPGLIKTKPSLLAPLSVNFSFASAPGKSMESHLILAYDDIYSVQYFGRNLRAWWRRDEKMTAAQMLADAEKAYPALMQKCLAFDEKLYREAKAAGGEQYAQLCELAYRQAIAAHKLVARPDGTPLFFSKENFSNGSIGTVDVTYPSAPLFLCYNPDLLKAMMEFIFEYSESGRWTKPFAAHDLGTYPIANGQTYPEDMPVEECGNMLILTAAIAKTEGNAEYARKHWKTLTVWVDYLKKEGFDPEMQLCTDDFAGHLARNANLSVKAIMGIASYGYLAGLLSDPKTASEHTTLAKSLAHKWMQLAEDKDHYGLAFGTKGNWSQKYNLVWDKLLELDIFPKEVAEKEMKFYLTKQETYGLPLDSRKTYTKSDWIVWTATLAGNQADFEALIKPVYKYANETASRVPISDWHETTDSKMVGFQARSVVGGYFIKMLEQKMLKRQ